MFAFPVKEEGSPEDSKKKKEHLEMVKIVILCLYGIVVLAITVGVMYLVFMY